MANINETIIGSYDYEGVKSELSENDLLNAQALFFWATESWESGHMEEIQTFRHSDKSIRPIFRIDQVVPENGVTVLFERIDGPLEESEFILREVVKTSAVTEAMGELVDEGYQIYPSLSLVSNVNERSFQAA